MQNACLLQDFGARWIKPLNRWGSYTLDLEQTPPALNYDLLQPQQARPNVVQEAFWEEVSE